MKRKLLECYFIVVAVAAAGYIYCMSQKKSEPMSQLMLENIEALASDDEGSTSSHRCIYGGVYCELYLDGQLVFSSHYHYPVR